MSHFVYVTNSDEIQKKKFFFILVRFEAMAAVPIVPTAVSFDDADFQVIDRKQDQPERHAPAPASTVLPTQPPPSVWQVARQHHEAARHPGSVSVPDPVPHCLQGKTCVVTGSFDAVNRERMVQLLVACGASVVSNIRRKTNLVIAGAEAGSAKLAKAASWNIPVWTEAQLYAHIRPRDAARTLPNTLSAVAAPSPASMMPSPPCSEMICQNGGTYGVVRSLPDKRRRRRALNVVQVRVDWPEST